MKAIETSFHGPTGKRGARYVAHDGDGNRVTLPADGATHLKAAQALCAKMGWDGGETLISGGTAKGYTFIFHPDGTYEGWSNRETFCGWMWWSNDAAHHARALRLAKRHAKAPHDLSEALRKPFEAGAPEIGPSFYGDLLTTAMSRVNWPEIAQNYIARSKE